MTEAVRRHTVRREEAEFLKREINVERIRAMLRRTLINLLHHYFRRVQFDSNGLGQVMEYKHSHQKRCGMKQIENNIFTVQLASSLVFCTFHSLIQFIQEGKENRTGDMQVSPVSIDRTTCYDNSPKKAVFSLDFYSNICNLLCVSPRVAEDNLFRVFNINPLYKLDGFPLLEQ